MAFTGTALKIYADTKQLLNFGIEAQDIYKQLTFAKYHAVNNLAYRLRLEHQNEMKRVFHRPINYTLRGIQYYKAQQGDPDPKATIEFITNGFSGSVPAGRYLQTQVFGGKRSQKSTEKQLGYLSITSRTGTWTKPSRSERNEYGNMPGSRYKKILSQLRISTDATQNATDSTKSTRKRRGESFFILKTSKYSAVFSRTSKTTADFSRTSKTTIAPVLYLEKSSPTYSQRYDFYGFSEKYWNDNIEKEFDFEWSKAIASAKW